MKINSRKPIMMLVSTMLLFTFFIPACTPPQQPVIGFHPVLSISEPPVLGKPVKVSLTFTSVIPKGLENRELYYLASIELAPGMFELVEGDLILKGRIVAGEPNTLEATVKSVKTRQGAIYGRVALHFSPDDTGTTGDEDVLFVTVTSDNATVSEVPPPGLGGIPRFTANDPDKSPTIIPYDKAPTRPPNVSLPTPSMTPPGFSAKMNWDCQWGYYIHLARILRNLSKLPNSIGLSTKGLSESASSHLL